MKKTDCLYIIPDDQYGIVNSYGPDDEIMNELNAIYRRRNSESEPKIEPKQAADKLGLIVIQDWQKRGDCKNGFYFV